VDPRPNIQRRRWRWLAGALLVVVALVGATEVRDAYANREEKLSLPGVANFGRLTPHFYRGAQPAVEAYPALRAMGIDTIIRLSTGEEFIAGERERVESLGMRFVSLPWRVADAPTPAQVAAFLSILNEHPAPTVFVHCREGVDRTGVMVALYRLAVDRWTVDQALSEMKAFHYHYVLHPHLEQYVAQFPALLTADPALQAFASQGGQ
jgi:protein tyrosine/serine phosphatase